MFSQNGKTLSSGDSVFERVGGMAFFESLVERFYRGVTGDEILLALYENPNDLSKAKQHLTWFLAQYWGGPMMFNENRGHPQLRMRHMPFRIGALERDRWLVHMRASVEQSGADESVRAELTEYFVKAAEHLRNDGELRVTGAG
ncbi:MAG: globin [Actinomycetota bacterium]